MRVSQLTRLSVFLAAGVLVGACTDLGPRDRESVNVTMQQTEDVVAQAADGWYASVADGSVNAIDRDAVASLVVQVSQIQFLPKTDEASADDDGGWISLPIGPVTLDLMALPTESESPLVIASGDVPEGAYRRVRLFVDDATIRFTTPIDYGVGLGRKGFEADVDYQVDIPSGAQTGIKTDVEFTVEADAQGNINDVHLLFDPAATFLNVTTTGNGKVMLAPVIRQLPEQH
jgi:hypothetical protein